MPGYGWDQREIEENVKSFYREDLGSLGVFARGLRRLYPTAEKYMEPTGQHHVSETVDNLGFSIDGRERSHASFERNLSAAWNTRSF